MSPAIAPDLKGPPFDRFRGLSRLAAVRSGHASAEHARHQLYVARDTATRGNVLIKVTTKAGIVYEQDLVNEFATLSTINQELPESRYFPVAGEFGRLRDGRAFLTMSCFDEWPLATTIGPERIPTRMIGYLRAMRAVSTALADLHGLQIYHVDLNPMNILCRWQSGTPVIRIVDFESSYEVRRHAHGEFYNPPTTSGYLAPEVEERAPDARSDVFSLGAVFYTLLAGHEWTLAPDVGKAISDDPSVDPELKNILLTSVDRDADRRYASAVEFRNALSAYIERGWRG